ncbi:MAG: CHASE3 domain-containing protein, partial [Betaproteobacteria bacterium]
MPGRQVQDTGRGKRRIWLRLTLAALVVSLFGLVAVTALFAAEAERTLRHVALQAQLSVRLRDLQGVLVALVDAENGERGYLLTDDARMLAPYRAAVDRLPVLEKGLDVSSMTATDLDSSAADARLAIADRLAELAEAVRLQAAGQHAQALALSTSDKTLDDAAHARHAVNAVLDRVSEARDDLGRQVAKGASRIQRLLLLAVSSLVVFLLLAIGQTIRTLGLRTRFEQALGASE